MRPNIQENEMTSVNAKHEALLDELLKDYTDPQDILGEHGLLKHLTKRVVERVLEAELTAHLGYAPHVRHGTEEQNARNGKGHKTVQTDTGPLDLVVPRDRNGSFAPQLVPKRQRRLEGFDAKVLSLYARGLSTREIQGHLEELYGTEVNNRGVTDCFIACVDGLKGLPEAIEAVFPHTQVQLCIVHKVRNSLKYVPWKERRAVAADLRAIYGAATLPDAEQALERFAERWDAKYPAISPSWLADWDRLTVFFDYPLAIRRAVYTTNAIESLNYSLRKVLKGRSAFPNDESITKVLYMGLQHVAKKWTQPIPEWKAALNQFVILFGERVQV